MALLPSFSVKDVTDLFKKGATIEAQEKIMELRQAALDLQEENIALRQQLRQLEQERDRDLSITKREAAYWTGDGTDPRHGPYCTHCYDVDRKLVLMPPLDAYAGLSFWRCPHCKTDYDRRG